MDKLTTEKVYEVLKNTLPKQNDFYKSDYKEELNELFEFGINTVNQLKKLLLKHYSKLLEIDSEDLDEFEIKTFSKELGEENIKDKIENKYWFAYPALLRIVMELEFGEKYRIYSNLRDEI